MVEKGIAPAYIFAVFGGIAQLVERVVRNDEAWGSNPHTSSPKSSVLLTIAADCRPHGLTYQLTDFSYIPKAVTPMQSTFPRMAGANRTNVHPGIAIVDAGYGSDVEIGQYTTQVRGKPESTGIGVVQVYFLP
jgi:hypothetical protein